MNKDFIEFSGVAIADIYGKHITVKAGEQVLIRRCHKNINTEDSVGVSPVRFIVARWDSNEFESFSEEAMKLIVREDYMTVADLIEQLQKLNKPNARVVRLVGGDGNGCVNMVSVENTNLFTNVAPKASCLDGDHQVVCPTWCAPFIQSEECVLLD